MTAFKSAGKKRQNLPPAGEWNPSADGGIQEGCCPLWPIPSRVRELTDHPRSIAAMRGIVTP